MFNTRFLKGHEGEEWFIIITDFCVNSDAVTQCVREELSMPAPFLVLRSFNPEASTQCYRNECDLHPPHDLQLSDAIKCCLTAMLTFMDLKFGLFNQDVFKRQTPGVIRLWPHSDKI